MALTPERLILASASMARAALLRAAGIDFMTTSAEIDEDAIKHDFRAGGHIA
jgi:predicted house-cleaning NTP pyrophosphatase (Maf/HAM1 superfamily)